VSGTEIAQRQQWEHLPPEERATREQIRMIQDTEFVPRAYRGKPHEIYACVLTGKSLGLDPLTSLRQIYIVDGKPTMSAELMVALVRRAGHSITGETSSEKAVVRGRRADNGDEHTVTFTVEDAKNAGLLDKTNWQRYRPQMLWARAATGLCRQLFADVLAGVSYTPEEATLSPEERNAAVTDELPMPPDPEDEVPAEVFEDASTNPEDPQSSPVDEQEPREHVTPAAPPPDAVVEEPDGAMALKVPDEVRRRMERDD
jgi:hypothetical protein